MQEGFLNVRSLTPGRVGEVAIANVHVSHADRLPHHPPLAVRESKSDSAFNCDVFWKTQCVYWVLKRKEQLSITLNLVISYFLERSWQIHFLKPFSHIEGILHRNHENRIHYKLYSCWSLICMLLLFLGLRTKEWSCQQPSYFYRGLGVITESLSSVAWVIRRYFPF